MPKQVLPTEETFKPFERDMLALGFREMTPAELSAEYTRQGLEPPTPREGREVCFVFEANHYRVVVWTTYLRDKKIARKSDAGRVLIRSGDKALYHCHPKHRTKNFLHNLLMAATITRARVLARPLCPKCDAYMHIAHGTGLKSRFWKCSMSAHPKSVHVSWDHGIPPLLLAEVQKIRRSREPYRKKLAREGKKPGAALMRRRRHKVKKPQNQV